jgi:NAD(P)-dependent dehydrogenase (short-subunit alcohol dehydrogenase family)
MTLHPAIASGRVAVVTGGASGIGLAAAQAFGRAGMRIVLADIDQAALDRAVASLAADGVEATGAVTNVADPEALHALKQGADALGEVSVIMNNAAREGAGGIFADAARWRETIDVNFWGVFNGIQAFVPAMQAASWPCAVINTGSKQGITLPPGDTAYNVSKAALKALTESLAHDLVPTKGRVTAHLLIPGFTFTGFSRARGVTEKPAGAWSADQVIAFMLQGMSNGDFYILCPDNDVTRAMDEKRMRWAAEDVIRNRPALSRWHPDYADAFAAYMREEGGT